MNDKYYGYSPKADKDVSHYGTPRHSGRYPWGSGKNPQRNRNFLSRANDLKKQGLTDKQIAEAFNMSTGQYRAMHTLAVNEQKKDLIRRVQTLYDAGNSKTAIAKELDIPESTVRNYLKPTFQARRDRASILADELKAQVEERKYLDVGEGVNIQLNVSKEQMKAAIELLKQDGYTYHRISVPQASDPTQKTNVVVLTKDDVPYSEVYKNRDQISSPQGIKFEDYGEYVKHFQKPQSIDSDRVAIRYAEDGGKERDGTIEIREGVADLSLGLNRYAQVRIAVDGTHYLKGMAVYGDPKEMPPGVDIVFNTNKSKDTPKLDVLKKMKDDPENPFGASIKDQRGALNIVNEDEDWEKWSKNLPSQFLSKQPPQLAKKQLDIAYKEKKQEFDEICSLTNPTIKRKLLESFADDCDSATVHLKAAALPRQAAHVILPVNSLKDNEIYAPNYENGEEVVLIRYPHAGPFEMPRLRVNNNNEEGRRILGNAKTAVGINAHVAEQLSGADFDGDTVTVIPTNGVKIKTSKYLSDLEGFDPKERYSAYEGMPKTGPDTGFHKQMQMGKVSNLITDMTIRGATEQELARAVKHSMVVIDAEKHNLDWRASEKDNAIKELNKKYQGKSSGGSSTLISRAKSPEYVLDRTEIRSLSKMTEEEREAYQSGHKIFQNTGKMKQQKDGSYQPKKIKSDKMTEAFINGGNAYDLSSGTIIEGIYAEHANKLNALANAARKEQLMTGRLKQNASAKEAYKAERDSLLAKLNIAKKNSPLERQAQLIASVKSSARINANPDLDKDDKKKIRSQEIDRARKAVGTRSRNPNNPNNIAITITDREWNAIQAGAISDNMLSDILRYTNIDDLKQRATPRSTKGLSPAAVSRARTLLSKGYTYAEVADTLGISVSSLNRELNEE
jgi:predicted transcriptional regulator